MTKSIDHIRNDRAALVEFVETWMAKIEQFEKSGVSGRDRNVKQAWKNLRSANTAIAEIDGARRAEKFANFT